MRLRPFLKKPKITVRRVLVVFIQVFLELPQVLYYKRKELLISSKTPFPLISREVTCLLSLKDTIIIAMRMNSILHKNIQDQCGFVRGRYIGIRTKYDIMSWANNKKITGLLLQLYKKCQSNSCW